MENNNNEICTCGVPFDVHGTCCGWHSAKRAFDGYAASVTPNTFFAGGSVSVGAYIGTMLTTPLSQ